MDGFYKVSFHNITNISFDWLGEWVNLDESIRYPTWKISCKKEPHIISEIEQITAISNAFSVAAVNQDYEGIAQSYTMDGKIFPGGKEIIHGYEAIKHRYATSSRPGFKAIEHAIISEEIIVLGDTAYDYGYYNGKNVNEAGEEFPFYGKYVVVWKKVDGNWKMYLDIWNGVKQI